MALAMDQLTPLQAVALAVLRPDLVDDLPLELLDLLVRAGLDHPERQ